jgi:hypothetical protein
MQGMYNSHLKSSSHNSPLFDRLRRRKIVTARVEREEETGY